MFKDALVNLKNVSFLVFGAAPSMNSFKFEIEGNTFHGKVAPGNILPLKKF